MNREVIFINHFSYKDEHNESRLQKRSNRIAQRFPHSHAKPRSPFKTGERPLIIFVKAPSENIRNGFQEFVIERITKTLARVARRITSVNVTLTDENGPRGGIDKHCRVTVVTSGLGQVTSSAKHEDPLVALRLATDRARRMMLTKLKRPAALRVRRHKTAGGQSESHSDGALQI